jgi:hypothetical protein
MASYLIKIRSLFILINFIFLSQLLLAQPSGSIWVREFAAGSANLADASVDLKALAVVDSLMLRDDLEVVFLGGADPTNWQLFGKKVKPQISDAWDQAKKLERASKMRQRYNNGQIGTTDEPIRGVKVVWLPKKPDIFKMNARLGSAENSIDSLRNLLDSLKLEPQLATSIAPAAPVADKPYYTISYGTQKESTINSDWEVKTGFMFWSAAGPYDLSVPYVGLALKRTDWAVELLGGISPWSEYSPGSNRGNAFLLGSFQMQPQSWMQLKAGVFSGWEYLTNSDVWTMKIMGITAGPKFQFKFVETYLGYTFGKLSSLTEDRWCGSALVTTNFHLKLN